MKNDHLMLNVMIDYNMGVAKIAIDDVAMLCRDPLRSSKELADELVRLDKAVADMKSYALQLWHVRLKEANDPELRLEDTVRETPAAKKIG